MHNSPAAATRKSGTTPKFSPTPAASETEPDRDTRKPTKQSPRDDTTPLPEPKPQPVAIDLKKSETTVSVSEVVIGKRNNVLPPTTTTVTTSPTLQKQPTGSEKGSTEEDEEDGKSSPLTETSSTNSDQMASVAVVFPPSADITQKGIRTMEDLPMGNTESDRPSPDRSSGSPKQSRPRMDIRSPSSSSLSELDSDDSEAETERLNISPQKPAGANTANSASYSTPKKSIGESTLTSPSRSPSPLSTPGQETPKSPDREMTLGAIEQLTPEGSVAGSPVISPARKRKRAESENLDDEDDDDDHHKDIMEISDLEDPPKQKSTQDSKSQASEDEDEDEDEDGEGEEGGGKDKKGKRQTASANGRVSDGEEESGADDDDESPRPSQRSPGKGKNKLSNVKPSSPKKPTSKAPETDADEDADEGRDTDAADSNQHNKDDEEADEISKTKRAAAEELATIEILFAQLRDKIVEERVAEIDKEIAMVQDGTHPELILMSQAIETHKKEKIDKANILLNFQLGTADQERIANRSAIWSQYHQDIRETRDKSFSDANKLWWAIHRERRAADTSVSDYVYKIPKSISTQVNHRSRYNAEVSLLAGIAKNVGFPAVPAMAAATTDEVRADLEAMGRFFASEAVPGGYEVADRFRGWRLQLVPAQAPAPVPAPPVPPPPSSTTQHFPPGPSPTQPGPSRIPHMSTFGPPPQPAGYSPRPPKASAPPPPPPPSAPQLSNAFQPSPPHPMNLETRRRSPISPPPPPHSSFHLSQKPTPASPRISKVTKGKAAAASKPSLQNYDALGEPLLPPPPLKRVPIKLEQSPTISSLSFAPAAPSYVAQQPIDRRMQVGGAPAYRAFGK
ncbi:hypothetical protein Dda_7517 [Drechslerella dactyloides]|uniref:Transcriptional regulatory protein DEP1 n=1 Tax=Drechslerella dactyloides TaxID=74499 RepID=A0AAD6ISD3_DREDA|nr:hypothetical protein Dda_7517 [Drechslerella dactyloides]